MAAVVPASAVLLGRQLEQMQTDKDIPGISCGLVDSSVYEWEVMLMISDECKYYGGESPPFPQNPSEMHVFCLLPVGQQTNNSQNNI